MDAPYEGLRVGRYELGSKLGAGGMGDVWEAVLHGPEGFRKTVALKLLRERSGRPADSEALVREARLGALLSHPNVVATYDLGEADGRWYLAMERVQGPSLAQLVDVAPLPPRALLEAAAQVCAGLAHVHALELDGRPAGLVHRDLKPSNLLLDRAGLVKIADLGIARLANGPGAGSGTPGYLAPEQADGREEQRSDLFALGVTLYVLALQQAPFGLGVRALLDVMAVEDKLAAGLCRPLDAYSPGLGEVVHRCLRRDPRDRWPDATALGAALAALIPKAAGEPLGSLIPRPDDVVAAPVSAVRDRASARTVAMVAGNLPAPRDAFFGRADELSALAALVRAPERLVVLKGPGGTGKTRLSLALARELATELPGGSWFVELADATTAAGVCAALSAALQVPLGSADPVHQLGRALAYRGRALFVLDNLEQVAHALPETLGRWLELAPEATFLVTSRVALRLQGERLVEVEPLGTDDAVALFMDRAPRPPAEAERPAVAALVDALERLPLAIELAAARTRIMSVARIRERLRDKLRLLSVGDQDRPARQRSMAASLDASWELASAAARSALVQLTVFEGGFSLEAAEGVVDTTGIADARWMIDVLTELCDASLLRADADGGRFRMAVLVAEYAAAKGVEADGGATRAAAERRHGAWFGQWGSEASVAWLRRATGRTFAVALADLDNLVAAARRALARGDSGPATGAAHASVALLGVRGPLSTLVELASAAVALPAASPADRRRLWSALASAMVDAGRPDDARAAMDEALLACGDHAGTQINVLGMQARLAQREGRADDAAALLRRVDERAARADAEGVLSAVLARAFVDLGAGRLREARTGMTDALRRARQAGDLRRETVARNNLGLVGLYLGELDAAAEHMEAAVRSSVATGDRRSEVVARSNLGSVRWQRGRLEDARATWAGTMRTLGEIGDESGVASSLALLGTLDHEHGQLASARRRLAEALAIRVRTRNAFGEMQVRSTCGEVELEAGEVEVAREHLAAAVAWGRKVGHPQVRVHAETRMAAVCAAAGDGEGARRWLAGAAEAAAALGAHDARVDAVRGAFRWASDRPLEAREAWARAIEHAAGKDFVVWVEATAGEAATRGAADELTALRARCESEGWVRLAALAAAYRAQVRDLVGDERGAEADRREVEGVLARLGYGPAAPLRALLRGPDDVTRG